MNLKIEYKAIAKQYKLTVAKDEVRLKLPPDGDKVIEAEIIKLSKLVAKRVYSDFTVTQRGYWFLKEDQSWVICMSNNDHKKKLYFYEGELLQI